MVIALYKGKGSDDDEKSQILSISIKLIMHDLLHPVPNSRFRDDDEMRSRDVPGLPERHKEQARYVNFKCLKIINNMDLES